MEKKVYVELPPFTGRNVPITEIAAAMHKDAQYVRVGLQKGISAFRNSRIITVTLLQIPVF